MSLNLHNEVPKLLSDQEWRQFRQKTTHLEKSISNYEFFTSALNNAPQNCPQELHLSIIMTTDKHITELNQKYRSKQGPTDVITFPFHFSTQNEEFFPGEEDHLEAEIYISQDRAKVQAKERSHSLFHELLVLLVHGIVHAFGVDHENSPEEASFMQSQENLLLTSIGLPHTQPLTQ